MELLLTVEQVAEHLQLTPWTIREHLKAGKLRGVKRGRQWRVPESALLEQAKDDAQRFRELSDRNDEQKKELKAEL
jgi:excisionase family DNA binding protein